MINFCDVNNGNDDKAEKAASSLILPFGRNTSQK